MRSIDLSLFDGREGAANEADCLTHNPIIGAADRVTLTGQQEAPKQEGKT
jgi:hypothetical protein